MGDTPPTGFHLIKTSSFVTRHEQYSVSAESVDIVGSTQSEPAQWIENVFSGISRLIGHPQQLLQLFEEPPASSPSRPSNIDAMYRARPCFSFLLRMPRNSHRPLQPTGFDRASQIQAEHLHPVHNTCTGTAQYRSNNHPRTLNKARDYETHAPVRSADNTPDEK